jgi:Sulfotransferase family
VQREWTWRDALDHIPVYERSIPADYVAGTFTPEALLEESQRRSGLSDFGDPAYRDGLDQVCASYNADRGLTRLGHFMGTEFLIGTLVRRLQIVDWVAKHPEIHGEVIDRPWIITGMTRSGSSLTSQLFDLDTGVRSPLIWEVDYPIPPTQLINRYTDPRIATCARGLDLMAPAHRAMHPWDTHYPQECVLMTQMGFQSIMFQSVALASEYIEWYMGSDMRPSYQLHKQMLQIWQSAIPTMHWCLKAPAHMAAIDALMETYPDARMIWNHRDPVSCIASHTSMTLAFECIKNPDIDPKKAAAHFNWQWRTALSRMMEYDCRQQNKNWCHHIYYRDLIKQPVATMRAAYEHFGENLDPVHARSITTFLRQQPKDYHGKHVYTLADFGLDAKALREEYADYMEAYDVPAEDGR